MNKILTHINTYYTAQSYVHIQLIGPYDGEKLYYIRGWIVDHYDTHIILAQHEDFILGGYIIIPINRIHKIKHNKSDVFYKHIIEQEGQFLSIYKQYNKNIQSIIKDSNTLETIQHNKTIIIIETDNTSIRNFHIGYIKEIRNQSLIFQHFDSKGNNKKPYKILKKSIIAVKLNDPYAEIFHKYITL